MPINVSMSTRARGAVRPRPQGGYGVVDVPNPNDAMATIARTSPPNDLGINLMQRGMATSQASDQAHAQDSFSRGVLTNTIGRDPRWQGLFQALAEAGATRLRTGAAAKQSGPGFFETQQAPMSRAFNTMTPRERLLLQEMQRSGATR